MTPPSCCNLPTTIRHGFPEYGPAISYVCSVCGRYFTDDSPLPTIPLHHWDPPHAN